MAGEIRWGILGTGWIAGEQTNDLVKNGFTVSAVGSRTLDSAQAFAARFGIPNAHGSYEELVADPEVDAIYVSTPHPFHASNALLALNAGKHALVEKVFTMNASEAQQVVDTAEAKKLVVLEAMWTRFLPHMIRLRELIAEGKIGEVRTIIVDHTQNLPKDPAHRINNPDLGGGALLDLGIYPVSFAWDIFGAPTTIQANASKTETGVDRQTAMIFSYADGQQAVMQTALDTAGPNTASIIGTKGWVAVESVWYNPTSFTAYDSVGTIIERFDQEVSQRGMQYQAWELERLIREGKTAGEILPPSESVEIMKSLDEVRRQIGLVYPGE